MGNYGHTSEDGIDVFWVLDKTDRHPIAIFGQSGKKIEQESSTEATRPFQLDGTSILNHQSLGKKLRLTWRRLDLSIVLLLLRFLMYVHYI